MSVSVKYCAVCILIILTRFNQFVNCTLNFTNIDVKFATPCETPNKEEGLCIEFSRCPALQIAAQSGETGKKFILESKCGSVNKNPDNPLVCCGRYGSYIQQEVPTTNLPLPIVTTNVFPENCGQENVSIVNRIVGGVEAQLGEFPWIVRLRHLNEYGYKTYGCSGFLIHEKYVLTAAHCVRSNALEEILGPAYEIQLGEHDSSTEIDCNEDGTVCADAPQIIGIRKIIVHKSYNRNSRDNHNDIALIHLKSKAKFTNYVQPICISESVEDYTGELWVSGWGTTEKHESSAIKRMVSLHSVNYSICAEKYKNINVNLNPTQVCAGGDDSGKDSCSGDSGGPLMRIKQSGAWFAEGVVSFGVGCGRPGWPGVYTYIPMYYRWIINTIIKREANDSKTKTKAPGAKTILTRVNSTTFSY